MRARNFLVFVLGCALGLATVSCGGGSSTGATSGSGSGTGSGSEDQFEVDLVRIADLEAASQAPFGSFGSDPLARGEVEVEELGKNEVEVEVQGAMANATYQVKFCSFATGISSCSIIASLTTDGNGNAKIKFAFPQTGTFAGIFLLTRSVNQFVTGFAVPATSHTETEPGEEQVQQEFEVDLQPVGIVNGGLGSGFGPTGNDPLTRGRVEVEPQREVEVTLVGAVANALYTARFCRFAVNTTMTSCVVVDSVPTDAQGNANVKLNFPPMGKFDGVFVLTRSDMGTEKSEFVTAFRIL